MQILIDNNTHLQEQLVKATDFDDLNELKTALLKIITEYITTIELPIEKVDKVIIADHKSFGQVIPDYKTPIKFDICFSKYPILFAFNTKLNKVEYGKSIIYHELQHCKEINITDQKVDINQIDNPPNYSLTEHYLYFGYHQWSEYYAYYHSSFTYPANIKGIEKFPNILRDIEVFKQNKPYRGETKYDWHYQNNIEPFVRNAVILVAHFKSGIDSQAKIVLQDFISLDANMKTYFDRLVKVFDEFYQNYPNNVSYTNFINIGKTLLTF